ncbi:D-2-hydroxyacid dehydrogenase [Bradyrhizobium huanghuaihaiense]|uniref:D-2-hydroxyacid dehydrogenase n=1 Tax=Bradyrhizobium huanghuaihaiense TaxID=990078 RepID=UPI0021A9A460|nr:D-2-hydroxyacid dehydrogenase [Bradyrhizobium sp. CB3035]UWU75861.1 D-2-hydroxyacid dehydrogenase [Bradyrhizobium sp. CB3035]
MTTSAPAANGAVTILIDDSDGAHYASLIRQRFPDLRVLVAKDAASRDRHVAEADVLLASRFPIEDFDKARRLRWFQSTAAGVDKILPIRDRLGDLIVTNARGLHGEVIADFVMAGMTMMHWDFPRLMREQSRKEWPDPRYIAPLAERTLGVVGLGSIGAAIARRGKSAGMTVVGSKRDVTKPIEGVDRLFPSDGLAELLQLSDFVVLAVPHIPETTKLIGSEQLRLMRRTAFLINIARGSVVAESELIEALQAGTIAGAVLDVFEREPLPADSPLWTMPNVIVTPHVAGYASDYTTRLFEIFGDNLQRFIENKPLRNVVDLTRGY